MSGFSNFFAVFAAINIKTHDTWRLRDTALRPPLKNLKAPAKWDMLVFQYYNIWSICTLFTTINRVSVSKFQTPLLRQCWRQYSHHLREQTSSTLEVNMHSRLVKLPSNLCSHWRIAFFSSSSFASAGSLSKDQTGENLRLQGQDCWLGKATVPIAIRWLPPRSVRTCVASRH